MKIDKLDRELLLEVGAVLLGAGLFGGAALLALGRATGDARRGRRHGEDPPGAGSIPAERHQHTGAVSAR